MPKKASPTSTQTLRRQARKHLEQGAVTAGYSADRAAVLDRLHAALATELVCVMRYRRHFFMARGIHARGVAEEFLAHSNEELAHADRLATRMVQLGGEPDFDPAELVGRSHAQYAAGTSLVDMIRENLIAERIAIDSYRGFVQFLGSEDPTTSELLKSILAMEEEHADDLADLLQDLPGAHD
ncbi:MAG: bacterioferritin [Burkholderiales bacterium PBB4]|nr:MAG: bacterioferritin [Burkholderiales bacterium PBB4]